MSAATPSRCAARAAWAAVLLAVVVPVAGCGSAGRWSGAGPGTLPGPVVELAGKTSARRASGANDLPEGPGAEGQAGDFVLENAAACFVVADARCSALGGPGGNVIDAALQGGPDRMRLLVPLLGGGPPLRPVYTSVAVTAEGGVHGTAVVKARGHLPRRTAVTVVTTYTLWPGSPVLEILTEVTNGGRTVLRNFGFRDAVCHGRTTRYMPQAGIFPRGDSPEAPWFSFYGPLCVWGVVSSGSRSMTGRHGAGGTELHYGSPSIPPGETRSYRRRLLVARGGPEQVWRERYAGAWASLCQLTVRVIDRRTEEPVQGAEVGIGPGDDASTFMAVTDARGEAALDVTAGEYAVAVLCPGRPPWGPGTVLCRQGLQHMVEVRLAAPGEAELNLSARMGDIVTPTRGRICAYHVGAGSASAPSAPPFPQEPGRGVALAGADGGARLLLAPVTDRSATPYVLIVSKGPLFQPMAARLLVSAGVPAEREAMLTRMVDPGDYVAVDLRQYAESSRDCALTADERARANACEGLDAAVVAEPFFGPARARLGDDPKGRLISGVRLDVPGVGAFSVYPARVHAEDVSPLAEAMSAEGTAADLFGALRGLYPDAVIQVDTPLDPRRGYFSLAEWDVRRQGRPGPRLSLDFDAIEILGGGDVDAARRLLPYWFCLLNMGRRTFVTGGSGSRGIVDGVAGTARTFIHAPEGAGARQGHPAAEAVRRLHGSRPDAFVTNGPFIEATLNGRPIGSLHLPRRARSRLYVKVSAVLGIAVDRAVVYRNGAVAHVIKASQDEAVVRCEATVDVRTDTDCWFVVVVEGHEPIRHLYGNRIAPEPFAVTNPFWVDGDGDGRVSPAEGEPGT